MKIIKSPQQHLLTPSQLDMWFFAKANPNVAAYNIPAAIYITGNISPDRIDGILNSIISRNDALALRIGSEEGKSFQYVDPEIKASLKYNDITKLQNQDELFVKEAQKHFDIESDPLFRFVLWKIAHDSYVFQITLHHIIGDRHSLSIIIKELFRLLDIDEDINIDNNIHIPKFSKYLSNNQPLPLE